MCVQHARDAGDEINHSLLCFQFTLGPLRGDTHNMPRRREGSAERLFKNTLKLRVNSAAISSPKLLNNSNPFFSGYYRYGFDGTQRFTLDDEWIL
jgi:hypothetical protein